jgi:hypothetical protein
MRSCAVAHCAVTDAVRAACAETRA